MFLILIKIIGVLVLNVLFIPINVLVVLLMIFTSLQRIVTDLIFNKDGLLELMSSQDAMWADYEKGSKIEAMNIVFFKAKGKLDMSKIKSQASKLVEARNERGKLMVPNLRRHVVKRGGLFYWEKDQNFDVQDHIEDFSHKLIEEEEGIRVLMNEINSGPIIPDPNKSQWNLSFYPYKESNQQPGVEFFLAILRMQHYLADGVHMNKFMVDAFCEGKIDNTTMRNLLEKAKEKSMWRNGIYVLLAGLFSPYATFRQMTTVDGSPFCTRGRKVANELWSSFSRPVDINVVKGIKNKLKVSVNDVVLTCFAQSLKKYFSKRGISKKDATQIAQAVSFANPEDMNKTLNANSISIVMINLPINCEMASESLRIIRKRTNSLELKLELLANFTIFNKGMNLLPVSFIRFLSKLTDVSFTVSNFPASDYIESMFGAKVESGWFLIPIKGTSGSTVTFGTYNNELRVAISVDKALVSGRQDLDEILDNFVQELDRLAVTKKD